MERRQEYNSGEDSLFKKCFWRNWAATCKRMKLDYFHIPYTKRNLKWIKDLNIRPETIKLVEESISSMLFDIGLSNIYLYMSPQARETKAEINK